jgi:hypothetical protein
MPVGTERPHSGQRTSLIFSLTIGGMLNTSYNVLYWEWSGSLVTISLKESNLYVMISYPKTDLTKVHFRFRT